MSSKKERRQVLGRESLLLTPLGLFRFAALLSVARPAPEAYRSSRSRRLKAPQSNYEIISVRRRPQQKRLSVQQFSVGQSCTFPQTVNRLSAAQPLTRFETWIERRQAKFMNGRSWLLADSLGPVVGDRFTPDNGHRKRKNASDSNSGHWVSALPP